MNSSPYQCNHSALEPVFSSPQVGAFRFGIAELQQEETEETDLYNYWISNNLHGELEYMEKYADVRENPVKLLDGAKSIIVCAFPYTRPGDVEWQPESLRIASYALGDDYHEVLRRRLSIAAERMKEIWGGEYRICIDTAPLHERYWAYKSGLGYIGLNGLLILPGAGSCFVLGSIITTTAVRPDEPTELNCGFCRRCIACCPANAIIDAPNHKGKTLVDTRRCLSCLTIEHRGELPADTRLGNRLFGCDTCQSVCPHNRLTDPPEPLPEFIPRPELLRLTKEDIEKMTHEEYCRLFKNSAVKRAKLEGLKRNASFTS